MRNNTHTATEVAEYLLAAGGPVPCVRCNGAGHLDRPDWIKTDSRGRKCCFRCRGSGFVVNPHLPRIREVRTRLIQLLVPVVRAGDFRGIEKAASSAKTSKYYPACEEILRRAWKTARLVAEHDGPARGGTQ